VATPARWLVRFGYDGHRFAGWARQPGLRTVEGTIQEGLVRFALRAPDDRRGLLVASRTDRGVSALGNAFVLESSLSGDVLLRVLNGIAPELFFSQAAEVAPGWSVRSASERVYRYVEVGPRATVARYRRWAKLLVGRVDVRSFGRGLSGGPALWRDVSAVSVSPAPGGVTVEIRAPSFVWGMVRKMISAMRGLDAGRVREADVRLALSGHRPLAFPLAEPEPLVLWDVRYPFPWSHTSHGFSRHQVRYWEEEQKVWQARGPILKALARGPAPPA
jgi:tRNA pseudouridine38-40 synthase